MGALRKWNSQVPQSTLLWVGNLTTIAVSDTQVFLLNEYFIEFFLSIFITMTNDKIKLKQKQYYNYATT